MSDRRWVARCSRGFGWSSCYAVGSATDWSVYLSPRYLKVRSHRMRCGAVRFRRNTSICPDAAAHCASSGVNEPLVFRLPATKIWNATPNVKIFVLSHPLGDLGITHKIHLWLDGKRIVDSISDNWTFSLALTTKALLSEKSVEIGVSWMVGHFECTYSVDGEVVRNPSMDVT